MAGKKFTLLAVVMLSVGMSAQQADSPADKSGTDLVTQYLNQVQIKDDGSGAVQVTPPNYIGDNTFVWPKGPLTSINILPFQEAVGGQTQSINGAGGEDWFSGWKLDTPASPAQAAKMRQQFSNIWKPGPLAKWGWAGGYALQVVGGLLNLACGDIGCGLIAGFDLPGGVGAGGDPAAVSEEASASAQSTQGRWGDLAFSRLTGKGLTLAQAVGVEGQTLAGEELLDAVTKIKNIDPVAYQHQGSEVFYLRLSVEDPGLTNPSYVIETERRLNLWLRTTYVGRSR